MQLNKWTKVGRSFLTELPWLSAPYRAGFLRRGERWQWVSTALGVRPGSHSQPDTEWLRVSGQVVPAGPSSGSLLAVSLSHSQTPCWACGPEAWLLPQPTSCPCDGDRKLVPVAHAPARQENEGKLAASGYAGWQTMHLSDRVIILPFVPGPPRTSLGPFPMTALQSLGTHCHIAQSLLCPIHGIAGLLSHSWSAQFRVRALPLSVSVLAVQPVHLGLPETGTPRPLSAL